MLQKKRPKEYPQKLTGFKWILVFADQAQRLHFLQNNAIKPFHNPMNQKFKKFGRTT